MSHKGIKQDPSLTNSHKKILKFNYGQFVDGKYKYGIHTQSTF